MSSTPTLDAALLEFQRVKAEREQRQALDRLRAERDALVAQLAALSQAAQPFIRVYNRLGKPLDTSTFFSVTLAWSDWDALGRVLAALPEAARDLLAELEQGRAALDDLKIIHDAIGQPGANPADSVRDLLARLARLETTGYCVYCGKEAPRKEIAEHILECIKHPLGELSRKYESELSRQTTALRAARAVCEQWRTAYVSKEYEGDERETGYVEALHRAAEELQDALAPAAAPDSEPRRMTP